MTGIHSSHNTGDAPVGRPQVVPNGCGPDNGAPSWRFPEFSTIHRAYCYYYR